MTGNPFAAPQDGVPHAATAGATSPCGATTDGRGNFSVHYELQIEDIVAFNLHLLKTVPHYRRQVRLAGIWLPLVLAIASLGWLLYSSDRDYQPWMSIWLVLCAVVLAILVPWRSRQRTAANVRRLLGPAKNRGMLGYRSLSIDPIGVSTVTQYSESRTRWPAIERIESADDYVLLFISGMSCMPIPKLAFRDQAQLDAFVEAAQRYHRAAEHQHG